MKFRATFKMPDAVENAAEETVSDIEDELDRSDKIEALEEFAARWVNNGETVTIEFDTEAETATVVQK